LCKHIGLHFFTLGQRKGIGLSGGPYYVIGFHIARNQLIVGKKFAALLKHAELTDCNWLLPQLPSKSFVCHVLPRYHHQPIKAKVIIADQSVKVVFSKKCLITSGQYCVFYDKSACLGAGRIK